MKYDRIPLDKANRMLRAGFGRHDGTWFARIDLWWCGFRLSAAAQDPISKCNPHPAAPHGFDRNASHSAGRYVCECEGWDPYWGGYDDGVKSMLDMENDA